MRTGVSVRATNETVPALAAPLPQRTGVERAPELVQATQRDRAIERVIDLPQLVPMRVF